MSSFLAERLLATAALLLGSAFFAGAETALFSLTRVSREALAQREDAASRLVLQLLSKPRRLIVTLILCNELINISASSVMATLIERVAPSMRQAGQVLIATAVMVPLLLLIGEMTPKSLAIRLGEPWA